MRVSQLRLDAGISGALDGHVGFGPVPILDNDRVSVGLDLLSWIADEISRNCASCGFKYPE